MENRGWKLLGSSLATSRARKTGEIVQKSRKRPSRAEGTGSLGHGAVAVAQGEVTGEVGGGERDDRVVLPRSHAAEGENRTL